MKASLLLQKLLDNTIRYGWYDYVHNTIITPDMDEFDTASYFEKYCRVLQPNEVWKYKIGTCWDLALLEFYELKKSYIVHPLYMEFIHTDRKTVTTHSTIVYEDNKQYYWFEYAWMKYEGIHGPFNTLSSIQSHIENIFKNYYRFKKFSYSTIDVDMTPLLHTKIITADIFLNTMRGR